MSNVGLVQEFVKSPRLLVLVERRAEYGLFIFSLLSVKPESSNDLCLEKVLPIDLDFKCQKGLCCAK